MTRDELVEAMARSMYESEFADHIRARFEGHSPESWDTLAGQWREEFFTMARAALSAAEAQGWVFVPMEPTEAMLIDGAARLRDFYSEAAPFCRTKAMYRAMLASTLPQEDTDER